MSLTLQRIDQNPRSGYLRVFYRDEFGQPRYFEFTNLSAMENNIVARPEILASELLRQINELLARPRPSYLGYDAEPQDVPQSTLPPRSA